MRIQTAVSVTAEDDDATARRTLDSLSADATDSQRCEWAMEEPDGATLMAHQTA